jgi:hypothetical protein
MLQMPDRITKDGITYRPIYCMGCLSRGRAETLGKEVMA